jgi:hypothetical protein
MQKICLSVDSVPELQGAGVAIQFIGSDPIFIRESSHKSSLPTYVVVQVSAENEGESWWGHWNGIILNCGGFLLSAGSSVVSTAGELPSLGAATPVMLLSYSATVATEVQCGLAIAKETDWFQQIVKGPNGEIVDYADVVLDVISLFGGIADAYEAVKAGSKALEASKYANELTNVSKSDLVKTLGRLEKAQKNVSYLREIFENTIKEGKVLDEAGRGISNNLLKRALPFITSQIRKEIISKLMTDISYAMSLVASGYGGVGPHGLGLIKVIGLKILQAPIVSPQK